MVFCFENSENIKQRVFLFCPGKMKNQPNILITGTPGVGKSRIAKQVGEKLQMKWHDVSQIAKDHKFLEGFDKVLDCPILDEDAVLDHLEPIMQKGGNVVEYHACEIFPERWFHLVFVIRCNNTLLYDRLSKRKYSDKKLHSNIECEIFNTILEEAQEAYKEEIVHELTNETEEHFSQNISKIEELVKSWQDNYEKDE
ncbi:adenylate kinase isoenzyme 6 homolog [Phlebotomus argentipes]|uniref:adenylate kinase isoenzyme 6 homolog n=1 Tax=Phlebotomus argentipes TaxID=94469 RepID=UPI0028934DA2|nr:adenylate kinase isoenzyme 6 homolog [Phlebotomus argentipes]